MNSILLCYIVNTGFRRRTKPNLLRQETSSILTIFRILYHLLEDENRIDDYHRVEEKLLRYLNCLYECEYVATLKNSVTSNEAQNWEALIM